MTMKIEPELLQLVSKLDISTTEKMDRFKKWQFEDGTKDGLINLIKDGLLKLIVEVVYVAGP